MKKVHHISKFVHIKSNKIYGNGVLCHEADAAIPFGDFTKEVYKKRELKYSKFFKMDDLSKLAFLGASILFEDESPHVNTAIILSNKASSLDTDRKHQASIEQTESYFPSPAVFVYTLPNIAIGEISIKFGLQSENAFFIFDKFNPDLLCCYSSALIDQGKSEQVLCGWVDVDGPNYEAFMYVVGGDQGMEHEENELKKLYKIID